MRSSVIILGLAFLVFAHAQTSTKELAEAARKHAPNDGSFAARLVHADEVIRSYRALGFDLQKLVHEDMRRSFDAYPRNWGLKAPDKNIDHRRVPNLQTFFKRLGASLPVTQNAADYLPGDLITCTVPPHLPHIAIVVPAPDGGSTPGAAMREPPVRVSAHRALPLSSEGDQALRLHGLLVSAPRCPLRKIHEAD